MDPTAPDPAPDAAAAVVPAQGRKADDGMSPAQRGLIEYLLDPRSTQAKGTQAAWAEQHGINPSVCSRWKKDPDFRKAWERRLMDLNQAPDRVQDVVDALWVRAKGGDVKAADLYLRYVDRFTPKTALVDERKAAELTDIELAAELENAAAGLRLVK